MLYTDTVFIGAVATFYILFITRKELNANKTFPFPSKRTPAMNREKRPSLTFIANPLRLQQESIISVTASAPVSAFVIS